MQSMPTDEAVQELAGKIKAYVDQHYPVTFLDLLKRFHREHSMRGNVALGVGPHGYIILWPQMSKLFVLAIAKLQNEQAIAMEPTSPEVYGEIGQAISLPRVPYEGKWKTLTEPHWCPVVIVPPEKCSALARVAAALFGRERSAQRIVQANDDTGRWEVFEHSKTGPVWLAEFESESLANELATMPVLADSIIGLIDNLERAVAEGCGIRTIGETVARYKEAVYAFLEIEDR